MDNDCSGGLILPDSGPREMKSVVRADYGFGMVNWVPIYCANCGVPWGRVPEENIDFVCWLCDPCSEKWGTQYGLALMPNEVFWAKARQEMLEKYGRILTEDELLTVTETASPLTTLLKEGV